MLSLSQIRSRLGHENRTIAALKIDCEGCEWEVFSHMYRTDPGALASVRMLLLEVHLSPTLVAPTPMQFVTLFEFLHDQRFRLWFVRNIIGWRQDWGVVAYAAAAGARRAQCCYELAFVREPD